MFYDRYCSRRKQDWSPRGNPCRCSVCTIEKMYEMEMEHRNAIHKIRSHHWVEIPTRIPTADDFRVAIQAMRETP